MSAIAVLDNIVSEFPAEIRMPVRHLAQWMEKHFEVPHEDFVNLSQTVMRLADAQMNTEYKIKELAGEVGTLAEKVKDLAVAQARTEQRLEELAAAQTRTEQRLEELAAAVKELAAAQMRTDQHVDSLEKRMEAGFKSLSDQIAALGSRWGIYNEGTFRATIQGILAKMAGVTIKEGFYGDRQVDVVIRDGEHILLEITSRMHAKDIDNLYRSADDYYRREGVRPKMMVATSYISPKLMQKIMGLERPLEIFSYEAE